MADKTPEQLLLEVTKALADTGDQIKALAETSKKETANLGGLTAETKAAVDKILLDQTVLADAQSKISARLVEVEQRVVAGNGGDHVLDNRSPGSIFAESEAVKSFMAARQSKGRVRIDLPSITALRNAITTYGTASVLVDPQRLPGMVNLPDRRLTVRDLITPGRTSSNAIQYVRELGFTNLADVVSEGEIKPESTVTFELKTVTVSTIAHWMLASKQILDDAPMLESHIDGRLRYGLAYVEEDQLLNGDGTGENLLGIVPQATAFAAEFAPENPQRIDTLRLALLQAELAEFPATGAVLHPIDWARIELTKDLEARYIFANPLQMAGPTLWGRPIVPTKAMTEGSFLAGAFRLGAQVFDREDAAVEISTEDSDNFRRNLVTLRGEERLALAVYRPEAFIYGDFQTTT